MSCACEPTASSSSSTSSYGRSVLSIVRAPLTAEQPSSSGLRVCQPRVHGALERRRVGHARSRTARWSRRSARAPETEAARHDGERERKTEVAIFHGDDQNTTANPRTWPIPLKRPGTNQPRLIVTDALGRRIVPLDKPVFSIGRRSESDLRLPGADISRLHAEIVPQRRAACCTTGSRASARSSTTRRSSARPLCAGDRIRLGQSADVEIVFAIGDEAPSAEKSAASAATELRQMAALLEGLRALGSGRVLDEVLALVLDSAIEVTGAERGFIMLANREGTLEFTLARARGKVTLSGRTFETSRRIPEQVFATGQHAIVEDLMDDDLARAAQRARWRSASATCSARRCGSCATSSARTTSPASRPSACCISTAANAARLRSSSARSALEMLSAEAALAIENARLYRQALDKAKYEQELKVAAAIQRALLPAANVNGAFFTAAAPRRRVSPSAETSSTTWIFRTAGSDSSWATSQARDRRRRCWRRQSSACSAPSRRIR